MDFGYSPINVTLLTATPDGMTSQWQAEVSPTSGTDGTQLEMTIHRDTLVVQVDNRGLLAGAVVDFRWDEGDSTPKWAQFSGFPHLRDGVEIDLVTASIWVTVAGGPLGSSAPVVVTPYTY